MTEEAYKIIKTIRQMEASLEDNKPKDDIPIEDEELRLYTPLNRCVKDLKEKYGVVAKEHRERFEQVKSKLARVDKVVSRLTVAELVVALESYSSHLEPSFIRVVLPPTGNNASIPPTFDLSPSYVQSLDDEFTRVYEEYSRRIANVGTMAQEIVNLWAELGTPQAQTENEIIKHYRESPEQLGLHESDISRLTSRRDKLAEEKRSRERRVKELRQSVEALWDRLGVEELDRKRFLAGVRGCGLRVINEFEAELDRLNELKRQNLHLFVEDARYKLQELWDTLYFSEEEMLDFTPAFSDVYSDALLSAHEGEIARLEALKEQRLPTLQLIERHRQLIQERDELATASQDASRLMLKPQKGEKRDPGKLLREEKMRKRIAKDLPKITSELRRTLERWEDEYGRPFLVHGARYLDDMAEADAKAPPPRSKTPSSLPPAARAKPTPAASRQNSVMKAQPPPRTATKTPTTAVRRAPAPSARADQGASKIGSPSKIPARAPLSPMKTGNNSPERRIPQNPSTYDARTIRKPAGAPARAPPPKMRNLFEPPEPKLTYEASDTENWRCRSAASSDSGPIHQISPEDVYDDREHMSYAPPSYPTNSNTMRGYADSSYHAHYQANTSRPTPGPYSAVTESRIVSDTSNTSQAVSGSENWETYDDEGSEPEIDASAAYQMKLKAARGKRATPEGGHSQHASPRQLRNAKMLRSVYERAPVHVAQTYVDEHGRMVAVGSDAGWTDEDAF